jgi:hypothetical protein
VSVRPAGPAVKSTVTAEHAEQIARELLGGPLTRRWAHTHGVAAGATTLSPILGQDTSLLVAADRLPDIGYAPALAETGTGFHPLDGARYLRDTQHAPAARSCQTPSLAHPAGNLTDHGHPYTVPARPPRSA